jgi:dUTP pyrophosphatase
MHLRILCDNNNIHETYSNHTTYHQGDSGLDLFFNEEVTVNPKETKLINLGIKCEAWKNPKNPESYSYYLYPRSSIYKTPLRMANSVGIIDAGYRGNIMVAVDNISDEVYVIEKGQRLFQICSPVLANITFELVNSLSETSRGEGGFGSTNQ